jgi:hypothetical protein
MWRNDRWLLEGRESGPDLPLSRTQKSCSSLESLKNIRHRRLLTQTVNSVSAGRFGVSNRDLDKQRIRTMSVK